MNIEITKEDALELLECGASAYSEGQGRMPERILILLLEQWPELRDTFGWMLNNY